MAKPSSFFSISSKFVCVSMLACLSFVSCTHSHGPNAERKPSQEGEASVAPLSIEQWSAFEKEMFDLVQENLIDLRDREQKALGESGIERLNEQTLNNIKRYVPAPLKQLKQGIYAETGINRAVFQQVDVSVAQAMIDSSKVHPVVGDYFHQHYNDNAGKIDVDIGFCFGRATYMDRMLQDLGVAEESIRKIWIVGGLKVWNFHVAAMVYTNQGWMVLDPHTIGGKLKSPEAWFKQFNMLNIGSKKKARVYVSQARKFGSVPGAYNIFDMGCKKCAENRKLVSVDAKEDWYNGYFINMLRWNTSEENKLSIGLTRLIPSPSNPNMGMLNEAVLKSNPERLKAGDHVKTFHQSNEEIQNFIREEYDKQNAEQVRGG